MNKLHPLNKNFSWQDRPLSNLRILNEKQVTRFNQSGCCILEKVVSQQTIQEILTVIDPLEQVGGGSELLDTKGEKLASYKADELTLTCNLVTSSNYLAEFYRSKFLANTF